MRTSKALVALLAALAVVLGASACGSDDSSGTESNAGAENAAADGASSDLTVGYSSKGSDEFQIILQKQSVEQIEEQGMTALQPVSSNGDAGKQLSDIQNLVSAGANAIMVAPQDSSAIKPALDRLESEGIPAVSIDITPVGAKVAMVVLADNRAMGEEACEEVGAYLKGKGTVLSMQGDYRSSSGKDRGEGFKDCMDEKFSGIEVIERPTDWESDKAAEVARTEISTNRDLDAVYMASDTVMLSPVLSALKAEGRDAKVGEPGHVYLISIDGSPFGLEQVRDGYLDALLSQPLDLYAKFGASYLMQASEGVEFSTGPTDHDSRIVEVEGNLLDLLPATLVTEENASDPTLWGNQTSE